MGTGLDGLSNNWLGFLDRFSDLCGLGLLCRLDLSNRGSLLGTELLFFFDHSLDTIVHILHEILL